MIPGIVELTSKTIYGLTSRNVPIYRFIPLNTKLTPYLVGCSLKDRSNNLLALASQVDTLRSNIIRFIGPCGDMKAEKEALLLQYSNNPWKKFSTPIIEPTNTERKTIQGFTFNIDPVGCRDIDDVITIGNDGYMYITIADVASWIIMNPDIFEKARNIGQTLYENGTVVAPLLPIQEHCSLFPNAEKLGISLKFKWDGQSISEVSFEKVNIINNLSLTYEEAENFEHSELLKEIASYLADKEVTSSHDWIEQFMIFYNCEVAKVLIEKGKGILRYQEPAEVSKIEEYRKFGIEQIFLANKAAKYISATNPQKHWGLKKEYYCHATSPIRRFADIINQMVLCDYEIPQFSIEQLNQLQQESKKYERDSFFLSKVLTSSERTVEGIVLSDHRIWVPEWNRIVTCKNDEIPGTKGTLKFSLDMNQVSWKRKMVFRFVSKDCLE